MHVTRYGKDEVFQGYSEECNDAGADMRPGNGSRPETSHHL